MLKSVEKKNPKKTKAHQRSFTYGQNPKIQNYFLFRQTHETPEKTEERGQFQDKEVVLMPVWDGRDKSASQI